MKQRERKDNGVTRMTPSGKNPTGTVQTFDGRSNLRQSVEYVAEGQWANPSAARHEGSRDLEAKVLNASRVRTTPGQN